MKLTYLLLPILLFSYVCMSQEVVPKKNFSEIEIGITYEDVVWILGFEGTKVLKANAPEILNAHISELNIDYDFAVNYRYIMDFPITSVYFREDLIVFFTISSYPEYNQFICQDVLTNEGLKFWEPLSKMNELYGNYSKLNAKSGNITYYAYPDKGICFGIDNDEVRTISVFDQDF
ncbi:hypothetical protein ACFLU5_00385 [Bacteroidota bacterium]